MKKIISIIFIVLSANIFAQDLLKQRVINLKGRKSSIYSDGGSFFHKSTLKGSKIKGIRSFYSDTRGFERIVLDLDTPLIPSIYGFIDNSKNKLYIDVLNSEASKSFTQQLSGQFLKSVDVLGLDKANTALELNFKGSYTFDVFFLSSPGRLVIDVKK